MRCDARFGSLKTACRKAELLSSLDGPRPFTLFAVTDDALVDSTKGSVLPSLPRLDDLLHYHIHNGQLTQEQLEGVTAITTKEGTELHVHLTLDGVRLNDGVALVGSPIAADNGTIYVIDGLLERPLVAHTQHDDSHANVANDDRTPDAGPGVTRDTITVTATPTADSSTTCAPASTSSTPTSPVVVNPVHAETGHRLRLVRRLGSSLNDINITLADSAAFNLNDDVVNTSGTDAQAFPEASYRPREPLEFMLGEPAVGQ